MISVIIPYYKSIDDLACLLNALLKSDLTNTEILVVDDHSNDSVKELEAKYPIVVYSLEKNSGPAAARNAGAEKAQGGILFFLDADVEPGMEVLKIVEKEFNDEPGVGALCFISSPLVPGGNFFSNYGALIENFWIKQLFPKNVDSIFIKGFATRNGAVRKKEFWSAGGFNTNYKTNAIEDLEFGHRLSAVCKVKCLKFPTISHKFPNTLHKICRNYYVRCKLYVEYAMTTKPGFDPVQSSRNELIMRMMAGISLILFFVTPLTTWAGLGAGALFVLYVVMAYKLMRYIAGMSGVVFALKAQLLHFVTSIVICAGGTAGVVRYIIRRNSHA